MVHWLVENLSAAPSILGSSKRAVTAF